MLTLLTGARIITPDRDIAEGCLLVEDGRIVEVRAGPLEVPGAETIDLRGLTLLPGFIDIHVHGGGGFDLCTRDPGEIASYRRWVVKHGVTAFLATVCAANLEEGVAFARTVAGASGPEEGATLLGLNLEGPFVNPERRGALPLSWVSPPDSAALDRLLEAADGALRLITIAPEMPGAEHIIRRVLDAGARVSVGHTDAPFETAAAAFAGGASHVTHAFNAMRPWHHREPGPLGAALQAPGVTVEVIADGVHLHRATVALLVRAFGPSRVALVTDAVPPAGLDSGAFRVGDAEARLSEGRVQLPDGTIAGSAATMDAVLRNVVEWGVASLPEVARMAASIPATVAGAGNHKGRLAAGYDADIVVLDAGLGVAMTFVDGVLQRSR